MSIKKSLKDALVKKAVGYLTEECVDEFLPDKDSGEMKIVKRKITTKHVPPDLTAVKLLCEITGEKPFDFSAMDDNELLAEHEKLLKLVSSKKAKENKIGR